VPQLNETAAAKLDPVRAADLTRVLDLQSRWENLRAEVGDSMTHLQPLQKAFETYRARRAEYVARYRSEHIPDLSPSGPERLGAWCRAVCALLRRAGECECPANTVVKALRMADRISARVKVEQVGRESPPHDAAGAIQQLDAIISWCEAHMPSLVKPKQDEVA
jgi:hypothetical protein